MKKLFSTMAVAAALFAGYNAYSGQNSNELSDVALANVEALAESTDSPTSNNWDCWSQEKKGSGYWRCGNPCQWIDGHGGKGNASKCYK